MAIVTADPHESEREFFIGLSSDTKPPASIGGVFYETDTQKFFVYNGSSWSNYTNAATLVAAGGFVISAPTGGDGASVGIPLSVRNQNLLFNGTTFDRQRNNVEVTELASGARTTTQTGADTTNFNHRGIKVVLDMTIVGTGSVTLTIQGKDSASGKYYTILAGAAVTTNSTNVYTVYPGLTASANAVASDVLPRVFRILVTANNANSATYSVGYTLLL